MDAGAGKQATSRPYLTRVNLGNPPKSYGVVIDTGSSTSWVACQTAAGSSTQPGLFDPRLSSTSSVLTCSDKRCKEIVHDRSGVCNTSSDSCVYNMNYGPGSDVLSTAAGYFLSDMVYLEILNGSQQTSTYPVPIIFGCANSRTGDLAHEAFDGILGFGPSPISFSSQAITEDSLSAAQQDDLSTVMNLLNIKQHHARALFIFHRWKIDRIYDCFDRKGRDRMLREADIVLQEKSSITSSRSVKCNVCFDDDLSLTDVSTMDCGHCFCNDCWTEHFYAAIDSGKKQIRCMEVKCFAICDEAIVWRLLGQKYPDAAKRFDRFLLESYLEDNDFVKWCPSVPHCGRAIRVGTGDRYCEVKCPCGVSFCFNCMEQAHSPCPCTLWKKWSTKTQGESENIKWILKNTKSCPKCFKPIEKRDGCNLVQCKCGQCLCWLCGGPTGRAHTWTSIEGHSCNRFKESENNVDTGRRQLERYTHYCNRFKIHEDSYKEQQQKLGPSIKEQVKQLESNCLRARTLRDGDWLTEAHQRLLWSRQVVSRSYAFAYYMFGGELRTHPSEKRSLAPAQNLFENQQEQLERHVEQLSKLLVTDIPALPDEEIVRMKQDVVNLAKILETLCGEMYNCIQDELLPLLMEPMNIAMYMPDGPEKAKLFSA